MIVFMASADALGINNNHALINPMNEPLNHYHYLIRQDNREKLHLRQELSTIY